MKIFLLGYMGSGKSTIASILGEMLSMEVVDTDKWIEDKHGRSIAEIFEAEGETAFRRMEKACLEELFTSKNSMIVATGGGMPCYNTNIDLIQKMGKSVYLKLSIADLIDRIIDSERPLVARMNKHQLSNYVRKHLGGRRSCYNKADIKVWNRGAPNIVAERIVKKMKKKSIV